MNADILSGPIMRAAGHLARLSRTLLHSLEHLPALLAVCLLFVGTIFLILHSTARERLSRKWGALFIVAVGLLGMAGFILVLLVEAIP